MSVDPTLYSALIGAFAAVSTVAIYLLIIHTNHTRKITTPTNGTSTPQMSPEEANRQYQEIIRKGQIEYQEIISTANKQAQDIISLATKVKEDSGTIINQAISELIKKQKDDLEHQVTLILDGERKELNQINANSINSFNNVSKEFLKFADLQLEEFKKSVMQQTFESQKLAQQKIQEEYRKVEGELVGYRQESYKHVEDNIYNIIFNVSKLVIGRSLDLRDHEQLIAEALEQTRKQVKI